jgi:hypothetical protein
MKATTPELPKQPNTNENEITPKIYTNRPIHDKHPTRETTIRDEVKNQINTASNIEKKTPEIQKLFEVAIRENPELAVIQFRTFLPEDTYDVGGYYDFEENDTGKITLVLFLFEGSPQLLAPLLTIQKESIRIISKLLGIAPESITPELLQLFIVAHELEHLKDFLINYQTNHDLIEWDTVEEMDSKRDSELSHLPVPNLRPSQLSRELRGKNNLKKAIEQYPEIINYHRFKEITTVEDLLRLQGEEYRQSEAEKYADNFAAKLLTEHLKEFGLLL